VVEPGVRIEEVGAGSAADVAAAMGEEGDLVEARLARGCRCFAVRAGVEVAGYGWLSVGPEWIGELGLEIRPGPREAYIWNCVTLPAHRRRGLFCGLLQTAVELAHGEGRVRVWIGTVDSVGESAVARAGFLPVLSIGTVEVGRLGWLFVSPAAAAEAAAVAAALGSLGEEGSPLRPGPRSRGHRKH
jgi:hypothetical protein